MAGESTVLMIADFLGSMLPHILQTVQDIMLALGKNIPKWVFQITAIANSIAAVVDSVKSFAQFAFGLANILNTSIKFGFQQILSLIKIAFPSAANSVLSIVSTRDDGFQIDIAGLPDESAQAAKKDCQDYHVLAQC